MGFQKLAPTLGLDPEPQQRPHMRFGQAIARWYPLFERVESSEPGACGHGVEFFIQIPVVIIVHGTGKSNGLIDLIAIGQVLIKGIIEIEMIVLVKIELGEIATGELNILQAENIFRGVGMAYQLGPLLDTIKPGTRVMKSACKAEFTNAAADVQYPRTSAGREELRYFLRDLQRRPMPVGQSPHR